MDQVELAVQKNVFEKKNKKIINDKIYIFLEHLWMKGESMHRAYEKRQLIALFLLIPTIVLFDLL